METSKQIVKFCRDTENTWLLTHRFPKAALRDLEKGLDGTLTSKSKWIFRYDKEGKINDKEGKIIAFMLIQCDPVEFADDFTHMIYFVYVRPPYRRRGILKNMVNDLPKRWDIWLEAYSGEKIENIGDIWEKCGFHFHHRESSGQKIYARFKDQE